MPQYYLCRSNESTETIYNTLFQKYHDPENEIAVEFFSYSNHFILKTASTTLLSLGIFRLVSSFQDSPVEFLYNLISFDANPNQETFGPITLTSDYGSLDICSDSFLVNQNTVENLKDQLRSLLKEFGLTPIIAPSYLELSVIIDTQQNPMLNINNLEDLLFSIWRIFNSHNIRFTISTPIPPESSTAQEA